MTTSTALSPHRPARALGTPMHARDALNFYFETDRTSASVVHCYAFDTTDAPGPRTLEDVVAFGERIKDLDPLFRRALRPVRGHLTYPYWVEIDIDVADHVFLHTAPTGVDATSFLVDLVVTLSTTSMGWERPPWQYHVVLDVTGVNGVPDGGTVVIFRGHHSAIDGMGAVLLTDRVLGAHPTARVDPDPPVPVPGVAHALRGLPGDLTHLLRAVVRRRSATRALPAATPPRPTFPSTRFNSHTPGTMTFDFVHLELARVIVLKRSVPGTTLNDVMVTVVSLALSRYLAEDGELPDESLGTTIPVSTRALGDSTDANRLAIATFALHTDIEDPVGRLLAVHESAAAAKKRTAEAMTTLPPNPLTVAPAPVLKALSKTVRVPRKTPARVGTNTMITNVPYGKGGLAIDGAPMVAAFGPLPTVQGVHLAHAVSTFGSSMHVSATSVSDLMPDTGRYMQHLRDAFADLESAVAGPADTR